MHLVKFNNNFIKKTIVIIAIALISLTLSHWFLPDLINLIEYQTYYLRYKWALNNVYVSNEEKSKIQKNLNVCIIDIDERSVSKEKLGYYGNWPRSTHGNLIDSLSKHYPGAILFDICFHEPEDDNIKKSTSNILNRGLSSLPQKTIPDGLIDSVIKSIDFDNQFAFSTERVGNVIHCFSARNRSDYTDMEWSLIKNKTTEKWLDTLNGSGYINLPASDQYNAFNASNTKPVIDGIFPSLGKSAMSIGYINAAPNSDGIIRSIPLLFRYGNHKIATLSLSVVAACKLFGTPDSEIVFKPGKYLEIGKPFKIFKAFDGSLKISFPHFSNNELKVLLREKSRILALKDGQSLIVTSYCKAVYDSGADQYIISMNSGDFPVSVIKSIQSKSIGDYLNLNTGSSLNLPNGISLTKDSDLDWLLSDSNGNEYYLQENDIRTITNIETDELGQFHNKDKLIFHTLKVWKKDGKLYTSIPVLTEQVLLELMNTSWEKIMAMPSGTRMEFGPSIRIPIDNENLHTINYIGPRKTFQYYSYYDILNNRVSGELDGKIFIIGSSLPNLFDIKAAPHDIWFPGVEIHASLLNSFLQNSFISKPSDQSTILILVLFALLGAILFSISSPILGAILFVLTLFLYFIVSMSLFNTSKIWIPVAEPIFALSYTFLFSIAYRFLVEEKNKKYLYATFSSYLSPAVIENMYQNKITPTLGGVESEITAFFTDIQGFSSFSEELGSPTKLVSLLNEYLSAMTDILLGNEGTLDKYEGDAIIAFFGAPTSSSIHPYQACLTALKMQLALADLREKWTKEGDKWPDIVKKMRMRIGVNSGLIVTGNMGSNKRMNYTMMGDEVNLAARLESAAKQFGVFTLIGENTYKHVSSKFEFRHLDKIRVVGKDIPVNVYELLSEKGMLSESTQMMRELYSKGYEMYIKKNFTAAVRFFEQSHQLEPNLGICKITASERMIKMATAFMERPPENEWDGTTELSSK